MQYVSVMFRKYEDGYYKSYVNYGTFYLNKQKKNSINSLSIKKNSECCYINLESETL